MERFSKLSTAEKIKDGPGLIDVAGRRAARARAPPPPPLASRAPLRAPASRHDPPPRVARVLFDVGVHLPFMYYPTFYCIKQMVQGESMNPAVAVPRGLGLYKENFVTDNKAMLSVWLPADIIVFSVPLYLRLPIRHIVSLGWTAYLSFLRGNDH